MAEVLLKTQGLPPTTAKYQQTQTEEPQANYLAHALELVVVMKAKEK